MVSPGENHYRYFIGCKDYDHKINPLFIIPPKTSAYAKSYDDETKLTYFFIEDDEFLEKWSVFVVKSVIVSRENLIPNPSTIQSFFENQSGVLRWWGSIQSCLVVILIDFFP